MLRTDKSQLKPCQSSRWVDCRSTLVPFLLFFTVLHISKCLFQIHRLLQTFFVLLPSVNIKSQWWWCLVRNTMKRRRQSHNQSPRKCHKCHKYAYKQAERWRMFCSSFPGVIFNFSSWQYYLLSQMGTPEPSFEQRGPENESLKRELEVLKPELQLIKSEVNWPYWCYDVFEYAVAH